MKKNLTGQAFFKKWMATNPVWRHILNGLLLCLATLFILVLALWISHLQRDTAASQVTTAPSISKLDDLLEGVPDVAFDRLDTLTVGVDDTLQIINPLYSTGDGELAAADLIFEPLIRIDLDGQPAAALADSWEYFAENRQLIFHLRKDHTFQDGRVVGVDDILFTYSCLLDDSYDGLLRGRLNSIVSVEAGQEPDTVAFTLADWIETPDYRQFTSGILKFDYYQFESGKVFEIRTKNFAPQGSGPYYLAEMKDDLAVLVRRPGYGGIISKITLQQVASEDKYALLTTSKLDIVRNRWDSRMRQRSDDLKGYSFNTFSTSVDSYLLVNPEPLPANIIQRPSQRLAILLTAAGKTLSDLQNDSLQEITGKKLLLYYFQGIDDSVFQDNQDKALALADQLQEAGLQVEIKGTDWPDLVQRTLDNDYDMLLLPATANSRLPDNAVILDDIIRPDASALIVDTIDEVFIVSNRLAQLTVNPLGHPYAAAAGTWTDRIENILVYNSDGTYLEP